MNVSLTPELENYIRKKVESGHNTSSSEVQREALRMAVEHDRMKLERLRAAIREGIDSGPAQFVTIEDIMRVMDEEESAEATEGV